MVYVIAPVGLERPCKIGFTTNVAQRLDTLQKCSPIKLEIHYWIETPEARKVEAAAHRLLASGRMHGEWFNCDRLEAARALSYAKSDVTA